MTETTIGIDISKDTLDVCRLTSGEARQFRNDKSGYRALIAWIGDRQGVRVIYEPTGPYHRSLELALAAAQVPLVKVNPRQARAFAEAAGILTKTDKVDAAMLARMGAALALEPQEPADEATGKLRELHVARTALVKDRTATLNRQKRVTHALLKRQIAARLRQIDSQLAAVESAIQAAINDDERTRRRFAILLSIPGISTITASAIIAEMPELGDMTGPEAASLAGLAPRDRQSGKWTGKARIRGGRAGLRQALYMPALVAVRYNPDLKRHYQRLIKAGKPAKVAITAAMRKLITTANALIRDDRTWTEKRP